MANPTQPTSPRSARLADISKASFDPLAAKPLFNPPIRAMHPLPIDDDGPLYRKNQTSIARTALSPTRIPHKPKLDELLEPGNITFKRAGACIPNSPPKPTRRAPRVPPRNNIYIGNRPLAAALHEYTHQQRSTLRPLQNLSGNGDIFHRSSTSLGRIPAYLRAIPLTCFRWRGPRSCTPRAKDADSRA
jgi:hypothetical protein